ncbi:hypothetical protein Tco_0742114 [Tanacetum coccineum]
MSRMILASVEKGPLVWPSITMDGVTRHKEYTELTPAEAFKLIVTSNKLISFSKAFQQKSMLLFTLLLNDMNINKMPLEQFQVNTKFLNTLPDEWSKFVTDVKLVKDLHTTNVDQLHAYLEQHERHAIKTSPPGASGSNSWENMRTVICYNCQRGEGHIVQTAHSQIKEKNGLLLFVVLEKIVLLVQAQALGSIILNEEEIAFLADLDMPEVKAHRLLIPTMMIIKCFLRETKITSDSNIIPYSQYVIESQQAIVQNSNSSAQQDDLILSVIEQLKTQVANCTKINLENKSVNDTLTAELERYKEQVKVLKEGQNVDLRSKDNVSDTCAQSVEIDLLKQTLSEHLKEKESLLQTDQSAQLFTLVDENLSVFYDNTTKQALGFQNPLFLQKAQQSKPKLYVGDIIVQTNPIEIPDSEETLALAEESCFHNAFKTFGYMILEKEMQVIPPNRLCLALNQLYKDFPTRFVPQTELSAE